jgi:hypothetical protein
MSDNTAFTQIIQPLLTPPATTSTGQGILGPLMRAYGHLLWSLAKSFEDTLTSDERQAELQHASDHVGSLDLTTPALSTSSFAAIETFQTALIHARLYCDGWDHETSTTNLRSLANAAVYLCTALDRDVLGLRADPGASF